MGDSKSATSPAEFRALFENYAEPLVMPGSLDWGLLQWDLDQWVEALHGNKLKFRKGKVAHTEEPQWERSTEIVEGSFEDMLNHNPQENWCYFDYKYLLEWFKEQKHIRQDIDWTALGFERFADDSTIWIGTRGAHTPCHVDVYGFNLVAQIYGRKRWLLFPPEEDLRRTRIPYEESSVYSKLNFYSPNIEAMPGLSSCREVILEPGQVLFVPNGWWHYVENLEIAISINTWLPLDMDRERRVDEALVQMVVKTIASKVTDEHRNMILNPNENADDSIYDYIRDLEAMQRCCASCKGQHLALGLAKHEKLKDKLAKPKILTRPEFVALMVEQSARFTKPGVQPKKRDENTMDSRLQEERRVHSRMQDDSEFDYGTRNESDVDSRLLEKRSLVGVLNALTDASVIALVKNKLRLDRS